MEKKYEIHLPEWEPYYQFLENLRASGITNMWGAAPYLSTKFRELTDKQATEILLTWMHFYDELMTKFGWRQD